MDLKNDMDKILFQDEKQGQNIVPYERAWPKEI